MATMTETTDPASQESPRFERAEDFASLYANNVCYELSAWDLKLIFGQLDQAQAPNLVTQHTAIALSWMQVKLMIYYLQVHLAAYEAQYGGVTLPPAVLPPAPGPLPPEIENDPVAKAASERAREIYALWATHQPNTNP